MAEQVDSVGVHYKVTGTQVNGGDALGMQCVATRARPFPTKPLMMHRGEFAGAL
jgi:hypothetical protein